MLTALLIVMLVAVVVMAGFTVYGLFNGCPFAWLWFCLGGLGHVVELIGQLVSGIIEAVAGD